MSGQTLRTAGSVALWSGVSAFAMLVSLVPVGMAAGLVQWWILRSRLNLRRAFAIAFALSFPAGQFPSYLLYLAVYTRGFGGFDGPPEWFVGVSLASGGLLAGLCQFLGLPKSWRNFWIWIPATCAAWAATALGDVNIRGIITASAVMSGLITGVAMLALVPRREGRESREARGRQERPKARAGVAGRAGR